MQINSNMDDINMQQACPKSSISELQAIISKMPLDVCCVTALPEFGLRWKQVSAAVRNARLPMTSSSVARVICRHAGRFLTQQEVRDIKASLRLNLAATQPRTWHVISLTDRFVNEHPADLHRTLPIRVRQHLVNKSARTQVRTCLVGDLMFASIQLVSGSKEGAVLYLATPPGQPVALVSSMSMNTLIKASVHGLGYKDFTDECLYGRDVTSLLRINDKGWTENADHLNSIPDYEPTPVVTKNGIDYTNKTYDEKYVDAIMGPNPPLLTELKISTTKQFFDPRRLNKQMNLTIEIKSDNVAELLKSWVGRGALAPTSEFIKIFHKIKSNKITYQDKDSDSD